MYTKNWLPVLFAPLAFACGDDPENGNGNNGGNGNEPTSNIVELALATPELSTLAQLVQDAGLAGTLSDETRTFTVFAPTNTAFEGLPQDVLDFLGENPDVLQNVLLYHVLPNGRFTAAELSGMASDRPTALEFDGSTQTVNTAPSGDTVALTDGQGNVRSVANADIEANNGVVHIIDGVLLFDGLELPEDEDPSLAEIAMGDDFTILLQAATRVGLDGDLADPMADLTVFAPTDAAFSSLMVDLMGLDDDVLENILRAHIGAGVQDAAALSSAGEFETLSNLTLSFDGQVDPPTVGGAAIATPDVPASNGIAHVMSEVIVPPTLLEVAASVPTLSTLAGLVVNNASQAIRDALAPDVLGGADPITVFAPTDDAFAAVSDLAGTLSQEELDAVLSYHVIPDFALGADLMDGQELATALPGATVTVRIDAGAIQLEDGQGNLVDVTAVNDVRALDGVVHVIDGVLLPEFTIGTRTSLRGSLSTLNQALIDTGLAPVVADPDAELTVFAPSDNAFVNLGVNLANVDVDVLRNILLSHVAGSIQDAAALTAAGSFSSLANVDYIFDTSGAVPTVGGADLAVADVPAQNGLIHLLDEVIVPPTTLQVASSLPNLSTLVDVVTNQASGAIPVALDPQTLTNGAKPITVLAPTNQAFDDAAAVVAGLNQQQLDVVLNYHVIEGQILAGDLVDGDTVTTEAGQSLTIVVDGQGAGFQDAQGNIARVSRADVRTTSGAVHVIDAVLVPNLP